MEPSGVSPTLEPGDDTSASSISPSSDARLKKPRMDQQELPSSSSVTTSYITSSSTQTDTAPQQQSTSTQTETQVSSPEVAVQKPPQPHSLTTQGKQEDCWYCQNPGACCVSCPTGMSASLAQPFAPTVILQPFATLPTLTTMTGLQQQPMLLLPLGQQTSVEDSVTSALSHICGSGPYRHKFIRWSTSAHAVEPYSVIPFINSCDTANFSKTS
ncbi:hypothetical protein MTO96_029252 [Rhipicephalus appendiculatus]